MDSGETAYMAAQSAKYKKRAAEKHGSRAAGMPWNGDGMSANLDANKQIPQESFDNACIISEDQAVAEANRIGYPVMLKASEGGGGPQRCPCFA